jgi:hypothetical protein
MRDTARAALGDGASPKLCGPRECMKGKTDVSL